MREISNEDLDVEVRLVLIEARRPIMRDSVANLVHVRIGIKHDLPQASRISASLRRLRQAGYVAFVHYPTGWLHADNKRARDFWAGRR
jgi:hypothetical protein